MTIIARTPLPKQSGMLQAEICLRHVGGHHPFVTHMHTVVHGDHNGFFYGNYHAEFPKAVAEYEERCRLYGVEPRWPARFLNMPIDGEHYTVAA